MLGRLLMVSLIAAVSVSNPARSALTDTQLHDLFSQGKEQFREAVRLGATDPAKANDLFDASILRFQRIIKEGGIENGKLYYNIANAYMRKRDVGRAILNYRRALHYIPEDGNLQANIAFARGQVLDRIPAKPQKKILQTIFFWHYDFTTLTRALLLAVFVNVIWIVLFVRRLGAINFPVRAIVIVFAIASTSLLGSLIVEYAAPEPPAGVIVAKQILGRKGPDNEGYEPSFKDPLRAGVEFQILEQRGEWLLIRLKDDRETWLPTSACEGV